MFYYPVAETYSAEDARVVFAAVLSRFDLLPVLKAALGPQDFNPEGERQPQRALNASRDL